MIRCNSACMMSLSKFANPLQDVPPTPHDGKRQDRWHSSPKRLNSLVSSFISPIVEMPQVRHSLVRRYPLSGLQVQQKPERLKSLLILSWLGFPFSSLAGSRRGRSGSAEPEPRLQRNARPRCPCETCGHSANGSTPRTAWRTIKAGGSRIVKSATRGSLAVVNQKPNKREATDENQVPRGLLFRSPLRWRTISWGRTETGKGRFIMRATSSKWGRIGWLGLAFALGLIAATLCPYTPLHATATDKIDTFAIATGEVGWGHRGTLLPRLPQRRIARRGNRPAGRRSAGRGRALRPRRVQGPPSQRQQEPAVLMVTGMAALMERGPGGRGQPSLRPALRGRNRQRPAPPLMPSRGFQCVRRGAF